MINGANSRMLAHFTGKTIPQEARPTTTSLNIVEKMRDRRLRWLGHILRAGPTRLTYQAVKAQAQAILRHGNLLMDTPAHTSFEDIVAIAQDRNAWKALVAAGIPQR